MRIISSITLDGRSAGSWYAIETAKRLQARGHDVLFVPRPEGKTIAMAEEAGLDVVRDVDLEDKSLKMMNRNLGRLKTLMKEFKPDVILAHWGEDHSFWALAKTFSGSKPKLIRVRALDPKPPKRHPLAKWLHRGPTDLVVTVNTRLQTAYEQRLRLPASKVRIIEGGIDERAYAGVTPSPDSLADLGIDRLKPVVVLLARFSPVKGHRIFLSAILKVKRERPDAHFLWVGFPSEYTADMFRRWFVEGNLVESVTVVDTPQADLPALLSACTVGVVSSVGSESVSRALLEYFACGLPAVATDVGGITDLMSRGDFGILVPPEKPAPLAEAILKLLAQPAHASACGARAREYVMKHCTWDQRSNEWETLLQEVVSTGAQQG